MKYRFFYKVSFWCDLEETMKEECGVFHARDWEDAFSFVVAWYGKDSIEMIEVRSYDEGPILITDDAFDRMVKNDGEPLLD